MSQDLLRGHLDGLVLAVLSVGPTHGYGLIEALRARSDGFFDLPEGSVYPALHRLERSGLVSSGWDTDSGRKRRVYALTTAGRRAVAERRGDWRRFAAAVDAVMEPVRGAALDPANGGGGA
jgi:DNA-binding PadR family transcriptional regulator